MELHEMPGGLEAQQAQRFFAALAARDVRELAELLDAEATLENIDGPVPVLGRYELAERLAGRSFEAEYLLVSVHAAPGIACVRFSLQVAEVPGGILLEAALTFIGPHIRAILVRQPEPR